MSECQRKIPSNYLKGSILRDVLHKTVCFGFCVYDEDGIVSVKLFYKYFNRDKTNWFSFIRRQVKRYSSLLNLSNHSGGTRVTTNWNNWRLQLQRFMMRSRLYVRNQSLTWAYRVILNWRILWSCFYLHCQAMIIFDSLCIDLYVIEKIICTIKNY